MCCALILKLFGIYVAEVTQVTISEIRSLQIGDFKAQLRSFWISRQIARKTSQNFKWLQPIGGANFEDTLHVRN